MKNVKIIGFIAALVIVGVVVAKNYFEKSAIVNEDSAVVIERVLSQDWAVRPVGNTGITAHTPEGLVNVPVKLDHDAKELLESYDAYEYATTVFTLRIIHTIGKNEFDSEDYANKLAKMVKDVMKVDSYTYKVGPYSKDENTGSALTGIAEDNGVKTVVDSVIVTRDKDLWEVTVTYKPEFKELIELGNKILNSVVVQ
ncbi:MAG: hypothetical protein C0603_10260 [Denitrovibrio sp.]|nr:MAG: hypothetical protein C0603_10260 [Denitrovibrio sp.]